MIHPLRNIFSIFVTQYCSVLQEYSGTFWKKPCHFHDHNFGQFPLLILVQHKNPISSFQDSLLLFLSDCKRNPFHLPYIIESQYNDFFKQRDNTAYNFRHNFGVYCRKEAQAFLINSDSKRHHFPYG